MDKKNLKEWQKKNYKHNNSHSANTPSIRLRFRIRIEVNSFRPQWVGVCMRVLFQHLSWINVCWMLSSSSLPFGYSHPLYNCGSINNMYSVHSHQHFVCACNFQFRFWPIIFIFRENIVIWVQVQKHFVCPIKAYNQTTTQGRERTQFEVYLILRRRSTSMYVFVCAHCTVYR